MIVLALILSAADLASIQADTDPLRRGQKALEYLSARIADARAAISQPEALKAAASEIAAAAEVAGEAYGKVKKMGELKRAEVRTREILRKLETLRQDVSVEDRALVEPAEAKVRALQESLLQYVLGRR
jgi:hypothetical protein